MGYSIIDKYECVIDLENGTPVELSIAIQIIKNMDREQYNTWGENAKRGVEDFDFRILTNKLIEVINKVFEE